MKKNIKILLAVCIAFAVVCVAIVLVVTVIVDPNEYKTEIVQLVREKTGRNLEFEGDIKLSFYPHIGFDVGAVALGNAPGFPDLDMVRIKRANVALELVPLLSGKIVVGKVLLDGLYLHLIRNAHGLANWENLAGNNEEAAAPPSSDADGTAMSLEELTVQGVEITNAKMVYSDLQNQSETSLDNLNLKLGAIHGTADIPFELGFDLVLDQPKFDIRPKLSGNIRLDTAAGTAALNNFSLSVLDLQFAGEVHANYLGDSPSFSGNMELAETSLRDLLKKIGADLPDMPDSSALKRFSAAIQFAGTGDSAELKTLTVKLDDSTLTAEGKVTDFAAPQIFINAKIDALDADRYMPSQTKSDSEDKTDDSDSAKRAEEPNLDALRNLILDALLKIGSLKAMNVKATDIRINVDAHDGLLAVSPLFNLYDGQFEAHTRLDATGNIPSWKGNGRLQGLDTRSLLHDLLGKEMISGTTSVEYNLSGSGLTADKIKKTVSGTASFAITDGSVLGLDVAKMIRDSWNSIMKADVEGNETGDFNFSRLTASAKLKNGHVVNEDLLFDSPLVEADGSGWADLPANKVDYKAMITVVGSLDGLEGEILDTVKDLPLPLQVKGALDAPSIGMDMEAMTGLLVTAGISVGLDTLADSLLKKMDDDDSADEAEDEAEDSSKDDIEDLFGDLF
ncbi:AsmA family protein [Maridesulfovibrio sp.]|uniref:AsmA family protein n=1 Tax=Maridesulfovibrio sp. TaxID=2795000 RepID=UPI002A1871F5|nr:AsmA family protein [Maridesulfovibrio sp.]